MVEHMTTKANKRFSIIVMLWKCKMASLEARTISFTSLVLSKTGHSNCVLVKFSEKTIAVYQNVIKACVRYIYNLKKGKATYNSMKELQILPVKYKIKYNLLLIIKNNSECSAKLHYRIYTQKQSNNGPT